MNALPTTAYTAAFTLCVFSAGLLGQRRSRAGESFAFFTAFFAVVAFGFACELLMALPGTPLKALWLGLRMGSSLLLAPCLWLAVREFTSGIRPTLADISRREIAAIVIGLLLTLPLIATAHWGHDFQNPDRVTVFWRARAVHAAMLGCIGIFAGQVPVFLQRCRRLLRARHDDDARSLATLPLVMVGTTWVLGLARTLQCITHAPVELTVLFALIEAGVSVGAIYLIGRRAGALDWPPQVDDVDASPPPEPVEPELLTPPEPAPIVTEATPGKTVESIPPRPAVAREKYAKSRLDDATRARIRRKLESALATNDRYTDSLLNLRSLSRDIGEKAHYVSQVLNQDLNSSFFDYVNRHRIDVAKCLLVEAPGQTVLEIALAVGFNAKSTFNTAFRRFTGTTPKSFRANGRQA